MRWHVVAVVTALMSGPALASECGGYSVDQFIAPVPFFTEAMSPVSLGDDGSITFEHREEASIRATFSIWEAPAADGLTRGQYLAAIASSLDARAHGIREVGAEAQSAVHPLDPISSMIRMTDKSGNITGETDMRLSAGCHLRVEWNASERDLLASRSLAFIAAIDAVRALAGPLVEKSGFAEESNAPDGIVPILTGFAAPAFVAFLLTLPGIGLSRIRVVPDMGRLLLVVAAGSAAVSMVLSWNTYTAAIQALRHVDSLLLLASLFFAITVAVCSRHWYAYLFAASLTLTAGTSLAVMAYLDWLPDRMLGMLVACAIASCGGGSLFIWQMTPVARKPRRLTA